MQSKTYQKNTALALAPSAAGFQGPPLPRQTGAAAADFCRCPAEESCEAATIADTERSRRHEQGWLRSSEIPQRVGKAPPLPKQRTVGDFYFWFEITDLPR